MLYELFSEQIKCQVERNYLYIAREHDRNKSTIIRENGLLNPIRKIDTDGLISFFRDRLKNVSGRNFKIYFCCGIEYKATQETPRNQPIEALKKLSY